MSVRVSVDAPAAKKVYILEAARYRVLAAVVAYERQNGAHRASLALDYRDIYYLTLDEPIFSWPSRRGADVPDVEKGRILTYMAAIAEAPHSVPGWRASMDRVGRFMRLRLDRAVHIPAGYLVQPQPQRAPAAQSDGEAVA